MKLKRILIIMAIVAMAPTASFAIVDISAYGGYSFANDISITSLSSTSLKNGPEYGVFAHLNGGIPMLFSAGIGLFYNVAPLKYSYAGVSYDAKRVAYGFDLMGQLEMPILIHPYIRAGWALKETLEIEISGGPVQTSTKSKYFGSTYLGLGAALTVAPFIRVFAEYLYTYSKQSSDITVKGNAIHVGATLNL